MYMSPEQVFGDLHAEPLVLFGREQGQKRRRADSMS